MGRRQSKSEEGNGVASPLSSLFSPIFPAVRLTPATVDHSTLSVGIREEGRGSNFLSERGPGFHSLDGTATLLFLYEV